MLLATAGLAVISLRGLSLGIGEALTLLGALLFAGQIALLSEWPRPDEAYGTTVLQCATATAVAGLPAVLTGGIAAPPNAGVWGALLLMGLGAGAIGFTVQAWAQAHLTATRAAIIMAMEPVFAGMFAVLYGEALTLRLVVGGSLVLAAILLVELGPRHSREGQIAARPGLTPGPRPSPHRGTAVRIPVRWPIVAAMRSSATSMASRPGSRVGCLTRSDAHPPEPRAEPRGFSRARDRAAQGGHDHGRRHGARGHRGRLRRSSTA